MGGLVESDVMAGSILSTTHFKLHDVIHEKPRTCVAMLVNRLNHKFLHGNHNIHVSSTSI